MIEEEIIFYLYIIYTFFFFIELFQKYDGNLTAETRRYLSYSSPADIVAAYDYILSGDTINNPLH